MGRVRRIVEVTPQRHPVLKAVVISPGSGAAVHDLRWVVSQACNAKVIGRARYWRWPRVGAKCSVRLGIAPTFSQWPCGRWRRRLSSNCIPCDPPLAAMQEKTAQPILPAYNS